MVDGSRVEREKRLDTGAAKGIGRGIAFAAASEGANIGFYFYYLKRLIGSLAK